MHTITVKIRIREVQKLTNTLALDPEHGLQQNKNTLCRSYALTGVVFGNKYLLKVFLVIFHGP
jgi:hypothetical protein